MSVFYPIIASLVLFFIGYYWYANKLSKLWDVKKNKDVPARTQYDGVDFVPARHWMVLFGHHFSSIAGAAPIIGPVIAVSIWGWGPSILWIVLGTIFIGGVHDFGSLIISVREKGSTIAEISKNVVSKRAKLVFSIFLWLTLILIIAVFAHLCAKTLAQKPNIVLPSWGLIITALVIGVFLYRIRLNIFFVTMLGLLILVGFILLGEKFPLAISYSPIIIWTVILMVYALIASITPVNVLLQPRDYLSAFLLFAGIGFGFLGLFITHPSVKLSAFIQFNSVEGPLWPMLFVTIACGAISGFHSLISSGTSSKQLPDEVDSKKIGYGGMVAEGLLALLSLLLVSVVYSKPEILTSKLKEITPIGVFGEAFGKSTSFLFGDYGGSLAIVILNAFIFTTLDTATRIGRYITQELFNIKSNFLASFLVVVCSTALALSGQWIKIWPLFGAANQLVAALTFIILTSWLLSKGKWIRYTIWPTIIMLVTTVAALIYQFITFVKDKNYLLMSIAVALLLLAIFMLFESKKAYVKMKKIKKEKGV